MKLACAKCSGEIDFPGLEIRSVPVERGDAQLFQMRDPATEKIENFIFKCENCGGIRARKSGEGETAWTREPFISVKVFNDPTPNGQINMRVMKASSDISQHTDLTEDEQLRFFKLTLLTAKKLVAVYKHLRTYQQIEDALIEKEAAATAPGNRAIYLEHAQELLIECDEFLVQVKSTLDYLVKVARVPLRGNWSVATFGDKGKTVIRALQNLPPPKQKYGKGVAEFFIKNHQPWLESAIKARDVINHMLGGEIDPEGFMVFAAPGKDSPILQIRRPMWSEDQTIRGYMTVIWQNLLKLVEDFVISSLGFRLKPGLTLYHGSVAPDSAESPWHVTTLEARDKILAQAKWERFEF